MFAHLECSEYLLCWSWRTKPHVGIQHHYSPYFHQRMILYFLDYINLWRYQGPPHHKLQFILIVLGLNSNYLLFLFYLSVNQSCWNFWWHCHWLSVRFWAFFSFWCLCIILVCFHLSGKKKKKRKKNNKKRGGWGCGLWVVL